MTIKLKSGEKMVGIVLFQNDEVLVIKDLKGNRYQYPLSDIETEYQTEPNDTLPIQKEIDKIAAVGLTVQVSGGVATPHNGEIGGFTDVNLLVGHRNILDRNIFVGGGIGIHAMFFMPETLLSIPLLVRVSLPLSPEKKSAPLVGIDGGYAFAISKNTKAGLFAGLNIGWQFVTNKRTIITLGLVGKMQQYNKSVSEFIEGQEFGYVGTRIMYNYGLQFGIAF